LNAGQPALHPGQVAIASPAIRRLLSGQVEREMAWRVARCERDAQRADAVALVDEVVNGAGQVPAEPEREAHLQWEVRLQRPLRHERHGLCLALAADDVRLPFVRVDLRPAPLAQQARPTEVRAVSVRHDDASQVLGATAHPGNRLQHPLPVGVVERVDQREALPVVEEERVYSAALLLAEAEDARREVRRYALMRFHG
jgi:hypothetical protein